LLEAGDAEAAGEFAHFIRGEGFAFGDGVLDAFEDEFLEEFGIGGVDDGGVDVNGEDIASAVGADFYFIAADGDFDFLLGELFLFFGEASLHLLGLFHEFLDVHLDFMVEMMLALKRWRA
jgi:hypothetical protein